MNATGLILLALPIFLVWYILRYDAGEAETPTHLAEAFAFGLLAIALVPPLRWAALSALGLSNPIFDPGLIGGSGQALLAVVVAVGVEELCKFLPLAAFISRRRYFNELTDGVIYFALVGICFGLVENIEYAVLAGRTTAGSTLSTILWRSLIILFFHAATTGIVGYYFARAKIYKEGWLKTGLALTVVIGLHAAYDYAAFALVMYNQMAWMVLALLITLLVNTGLFLFLRQAWRLDLAMGRAGRTCFDCGRRLLGGQRYCSHCHHWVG